MQENDNHIGRISLIFLLMLILALFIRIIILQNLDSFNRKRYLDPVVSSSLVRGTIYDRNGNILAIQAPDYGFYIDLKESEPGYVASILESYLSQDAIRIEEMLKKGVKFFPLSYIPTKEEADYLKRLITNFSLDKEVTLELKEVRKYPSEQSTHAIVGDVDENLDGTSGIEKLYNDYLIAKPELSLKTVKGSSIVLTLDADIQFAINNLPALRDYEDSTITVLNGNDEIISYHGNVSDQLLEKLVYSITSEEGTTVFDTKQVYKKENLMLIDDYKIYIDAPNDKIKNDLYKGIVKTLYSMGRVKTEA